MYNKPSILLILLNFFEILALLAGIINYNNIKKTYWKWFVVYLIIIVIYELFGVKIFNYFNIEERISFSYFIVPLEFLFFIWLYALKSLKKEKLFITCSCIYILSFFPNLSILKGKFIFDSFNYMIGALIMLILVSLEFLKQIKNENILMFNQNKMFYINIGIILFYVGNLPFFGLYYPIMKEPKIWNLYYIYFMISNCIMYFLFAASFIWGKPKS
jgi:hypothetical protein